MMDKMETNQAEKVLVLQDVIRFFPPHYRVLNQVCLEITSGESLRILGKAGSGKTTLTEILTGLTLPDSGEVLFRGRSLSRMSEKERQQMRWDTFGVFTGNGGLLPSLTVEENLLAPLLFMGHKGQTARQEISHALEKFGAEATAVRRPIGLTPLEEGLVQLAGAWVRQPEILIADSFPRGLIPEEEARLWSFLQQFQRERSGILIHLTDDVGQTGPVDRTLYLKGGRLWEEEIHI